MPRRLFELCVVGFVVSAALGLSGPATPASAATVGGPALVAGAGEPVDAAAVSTWGGAPTLGAPRQLNAPLAGIVATPDGRGYWLVAADGGVFAYGDASFEGSTASGVPDQPELDGIPTVGLAATPDGRGYWLVDGIGHVSGFGDAAIYAWPGTSGNVLQRSVVGMAGTHDGHGYWLVGSDGGVFALGDATFDGSAATLPLNAPVVGLAATPDGGGYWLVAADGGVFAYGDASFSGSAARTPPAHPVIGVAASAGGHGYWLVTSGTGPMAPQATQVIADCQNAQVEPNTFILACADHNSFLTGLTWSSWTPAAASGSGTYWQNDCTPDCAQGHFESSPGATIELSRPIATSAGVEFTALTLSYADPAAGGAPRRDTEGWYTSPT